MTATATASATATPVQLTPLRVLVVDDHPAVRIGLAELLGDQPDLVLVGVVATAEQALSLAERQAVDVAVVDYQLGAGRNGLWVSRKLKRLPRPPRVLIYSAYSDGILAAAAVVAQADGLLSKGSLGDELCAAIRALSTSGTRLPRLAPRVADLVRSALDQSQQAVFGMLLAGIAPQEIARTLGLTRAELESQLGTMLRNLEALPPRTALSAAAR